MLASELVDKNNKGRRMEHVELVFVIAVACKKKTMLTRPAREKIKKANAQRVREVQERSEKRMSRKSSDQDERKQKIDSKKSGERKEKGIMKSGMGKGVRRGLKALKEIKRYQSSSGMLIRRLRLEIPKYGHHAPSVSRGGFPGEIVGAIESVCHSCKVSHSNDQRYSPCTKNQGGYLNFVGICPIDDFIFLTCLIYCFIFCVNLLMYNSRIVLEECHGERQ